MSSIDASPAQREAERLLDLQRYDILDTPPEPAFDELTTLAARLFGVPMALVSLIDRDRQWFKSRVGISDVETPRDIAFCDHAIRDSDVMVVEDAAVDPRFANNPLVTGELALRFYAGAPLISPQGRALGTLCVLDRQPRRFNAADRETLAVLSRQVVGQLELRKQNRALLRAMADSQQEHEQLLRSQRQFEDSLSLLNNLAQHVPGLIYQYRRYPDGRSCFPFTSQGLWDIYEVSAEAVREDASPVFAHLHPQDIEMISASIEASAVNLSPWHLEYRVRLPVQGERWRLGDAQPERLADGSVLWHGFITDITERKQADADTHRLAYFDALTGLPNRRLLLDRMAHALAAAQRSGQCGAVLFVDLDHFKHINDARGHSVGDQLLTQVALRLSALLRQEDTVARLGGDEFVVLVNSLGPDAEAAARHAMAIADKVRDALESQFDIDHHAYSTTGSIGITVFPKHEQAVDDLLREADTAMYRAKSGGRNRISFFESAMQAEVEQRLALQQDLKRAVADGQISVHLQPQVDAAGREIGGELLLRWTHPTRGPVSPAEFIPVAEESGLILRLGEMVIRWACVALARLQRAGLALTLSVNVSPRQFRQDNFVDQVRDIVRETGVRADGLIFEVTEGLLIDNVQAASERMSELVELGIRFSIDDFGTGYSSLAYLKRLPLYELKIDRSFVQDTPGDANDTAIVQAILSVARHLKLRVVAEGVETRAQADFLALRDCDCLQGYYFGRPRPLDDWLDQRLQAEPSAFH